MKRIQRVIRFIIPLLMLIGLLLPAVLIRAETVVPAKSTDIKTYLVLNLLGNYYDRIRAGEETGLYLEVRNQSDISITNIRFSAALPEGWSARFVPAELASLTAGSADTIEAFVTAPENAGGGYDVTFLAKADQTSAAASVYLNVKGGSTLWLWLGIGIGVIVIAGFILVFLRLGKH
jgi:uncharacterized membrane protein